MRRNYEIVVVTKADIIRIPSGRTLEVGVGLRLHVKNRVGKIVGIFDHPEWRFAAYCLEIVIAESPKEPKRDE